MDHELYVIRNRVIDYIQMQSRDFTRNIHFLARPGQGKSLAAAQMIPRLSGPFIWYNVMAADKDMAYFVETLCRVFSNCFKDFSADSVMTLIEADGNAHPKRCADYLLQELNRVSLTKTHLFFDDVHILNESLPSRQFLGALAECFLNLVLISNKPVPGIVAARGSSGFIVIDNDALAMTKSEISLFFNRTLRVPVSVSEVNKIYQATEGWIKGVISLKDTIGKHKSRRRKTDCVEIHHGPFPMAQEMNHFFRDEIGSSLNDQVIRQLSVLSEFPEVIPGLSSVLTGERKIDSELESLAERTFFIKKKNGSLVFHPFFRQYLKQNRPFHLSGPEQETILTDAANWFESSGNYGESLRYYLKAGAYATADNLFEKKGLELYSENKIYEISDELSSISGATFRSYPNLSICKGISIAESDPDAAFRYFSEARERFAEQENRTGNLTALFFLIRYHVTVDIRCDRIEGLLREVNESSLEFTGEKPPLLQLYIDLAVAEAEAVTSCTFDKTEWLYTQRPVFFRHSAANNFLVRMILNNMDRSIAHSDYPALCNEMERLYPMIHSGRVNAFNKMLIHVYALSINFLSGYGFNYLYFKNIILKTTKRAALESSNRDREMGLQEIQCLLSKNEFCRASESIDVQLRGMVNERDAHYISQLLQYKAYISGVNGNEKELCRYAAKSAALRKQIGGEFFVLLNHLVIGGAFSHVEDAKAGELHLGEAIARSTRLGAPYIKILALFHRAYLRLNTKNAKGFETDFKDAMELVVSKKFSDYFLWIPEIVLVEIFSAAVKKNIEPDNVRKIASRRLNIAFIKGGEAIPRLQLFALGRFHIRCNGNEIASSGDLTRIQLEILSILISSPRRKIDLDELQLVFWPDSTGKKGRANLNVALNRLRSVLKTKIIHGDIKNYIRVRNGQLMLEHCDTDLQDFIFFARKGTAFFRNGKMWQASNMFRMAHTYYKGEYMPCVILSDRDTEFKENTLLPLYYETIEKWCDIILSETYYNDEDMLILEHSMGEILNNHEIVIKLYRIYTCFGKTVKAVLIIKQYRKMLQREGFTDDEVREIMVPVLDEIEKCKKNVIFV